MIGPHVLRNFVFIVPDIVEGLKVVHQPETVEKQHDGRVFHNGKHRVTEGVVHSWRQSVVVSHLDSLSKPLVCNDNARHKEHDGHAKSIQHSQEGDVEAIRVFEMDWHIFTIVHGLVSLDCSLSRSEWVS